MLPPPIYRTSETKRELILKILLIILSKLLIIATAFWYSLQIDG